MVCLIALHFSLNFNILLYFKFFQCHDISFHCNTFIKFHYISLVCIICLSTRILHYISRYFTTFQHICYSTKICPNFSLSLSFHHQEPSKKRQWRIPKPQKEDIKDGVWRTEEERREAKKKVWTWRKDGTNEGRGQTAWWRTEKAWCWSKKGRARAEGSNCLTRRRKKTSLWSVASAKQRAETADGRSWTKNKATDGNYGSLKQRDAAKAQELKDLGGSEGRKNKLWRGLSISPVFLPPFFQFLISLWFVFAVSGFFVFQ